MTRISVAIASYNGARHIGEQLDSIAAQRRPVDELVVADDGSTDETVAVVEGFAARAPFPVRLVRHPRNVGILENFHAAFAACTGDLIFYCDQDDRWRGDKVALVAAAFEPGVAMVAHQSSIADGDLRETGRVEPANPRYGRLRFPADAGLVRMWGHQSAFTSAVLAVMQGLHASRDPAVVALAASLDSFIPACAALVGDLVLLPQPLTAFRRHGGATSGAGAHYLAPETRRQQARRAAAEDLRQAQGGIVLADAAAAAGLVPADRAGAVRACHVRKLRIAERQAAGGAALVGAAAAGMRGTGFSNDRRLRGLAMTGLLTAGR